MEYHFSAAELKSSRFAIFTYNLFPTEKAGESTSPVNINESTPPDTTRLAKNPPGCAQG